MEDGGCGIFQKKLVFGKQLKNDGQTNVLLEICLTFLTLPGARHKGQISVEMLMIFKTFDSDQSFGCARHPEILIIVDLRFETAGRHMRITSNY